MKVYLMAAEHYSVPGVVVQVCSTRALAVQEALECVNIMLKDKNRKPVTDELGMERAMEKLQDEYGEVNCYVDIRECEVL